MSNIDPDKICGNCKHWDSDMSYCPEKGETMYELDCCDDGWEDDNDGGLTEKEIREVTGRKK